VKTGADLRGKSVGMARIGDLSDVVSRLAVEHFGLRPNEDVDLRPIGGSQPERYAMLVAGIVQGVVITPPLDARARQDGLNVLFDLADLGRPFIYSAVHAGNGLIRDNPQLAQRFVAAMAESVYYTEKNPDVARRALRKVLEVEDVDALDSAYTAYARKLINRRMTIPLDSVQTAIDEARDSGTRILVGSPADVATNQFVDDLDRTGYLQQLWGAELPPK
jgi:ABC-type nitrate/sulfonate/bicarbonate transport system substrate-binding protein